MLYRTKETDMKTNERHYAAKYINIPLEEVVLFTHTHTHTHTHTDVKKAVLFNGYSVASVPQL